MRRPCIMLLLSLTSVDSTAADLTPPDWRGGPGTTYQSWGFGFEQSSPGGDPDCARLGFIQTPQGQQARPDTINNPYEAGSGLCTEFKSLWFLTGQQDWFANYRGRAGVWQLQDHRPIENFLNFIIPGAGLNGRHHGRLQVQLIHFSVSGAPVVTVQSPVYAGQPSPASMALTQTTPLPGDWQHASYQVEVEGCPRYHSIFITPPAGGEVHIDSVSIDTRCLVLETSP